MSEKVYLECLYTRHKTQKRKIWSDGKAVVDTQSLRLRIYNANSILGASNSNTALDELELERNELESIIKLLSTDLETEKFLVTIEGPWKETAPLSTVNASVGQKTTTQNLSRSKPKIRNGGMQNLLNKKFRLPPARIPPPPEEKKRQILEDEQNGTSRKRPVQPGELERRYYGEVSNAFQTRQDHPLQQQQQSQSQSNKIQMNYPTNPVIESNIPQHPSSSSFQSAKCFDVNPAIQSNTPQHSSSSSFRNATDFDVSHFYGEEDGEEEEEEEEEEGKEKENDEENGEEDDYDDELLHQYEISSLPMNTKTQVQNNPVSKIQSCFYISLNILRHATFKSNTVNNWKGAQVSSDHINKTPKSASYITDKAESSSNNVLSKNDLLSLFGGSAATTTPSNSSSLENEIQADASIKTSSNATNNKNNNFLKHLLEAEDEIEQNSITHPNNSFSSSYLDNTSVCENFNDDDDYSDDIPIEETSSVGNEKDIFALAVNEGQNLPPQQNDEKDNNIRSDVKLGVIKDSSFDKLDTCKNLYLENCTGKELLNSKIATNEYEGEEEEEEDDQSDSQNPFVLSNEMLSDSSSSDSE